MPLDLGYWDRDQLPCVVRTRYTPELFELSERSVASRNIFTRSKMSGTRSSSVTYYSLLLSGVQYTNVSKTVVASNPSWSFDKLEKWALHDCLDWKLDDMPARWETPNLIQNLQMSTNGTQCKPYNNVIIILRRGLLEEEVGINLTE